MAWDRAASRRARTKFVDLVPRWGGVCMALFLIVPGTIGTALADDVETRSSLRPLGILWFSIRGLDGEHNELDRILEDAGQLCVHKFRGYILSKPGECELERAFTEFLKRLPPSQPAIAEKLQSLGAVCKQTGARLSCVYRKHENYRAFIGSVLMSEEDDFHTIELRVTKVGSKLEYFTNAERRVTKIYDRNKTLATKPGKEK